MPEVYLEKGEDGKTFKIVSGKILFGITTKHAGSMARLTDERKNDLCQLFSLPEKFGICSILPEHGNAIYSVSSAGRRKCDGLFCYANDDLALASITGDCPTIGLFAQAPDPMNPGKKIPAIGIVHSGRRGIEANIAGKAVEQFCSFYKTTLRAVIWPGICPDCYTLDEIPSGLDDFCVHDGKKFRLDMAMAINHQLETAGIKSRDIFTISKFYCPACTGHNLFFSHRGEESGRNAVIIAAMP